MQVLAPRTRPSSPPVGLHPVCRYEVLYNQLGVTRLVEYVKLGLLDHTRVITMKVDLRTFLHQLLRMCGT